MSDLKDKYEVVIGLEVHAQLGTETKLFCGDSAAFGGAPNTHVSPITLALPGTLPKTNKKAVEYAVKMGIACNCKIADFTYFSRKNYFYPDLPKGFQISQNVHPICDGGEVRIKSGDHYRNVQLDHIHLEDDAGKSIHDVYDDRTCVDYNRAGVPLIEIVTLPDMHSAEEAFQYVTEVRKLVRWIGICDGNMEEGSLRCDANVSIRLKGETKLGTKVEVKNLNSIRNVKKAIEFEIDRMIDLVEAGGTVIQQTRSFDASNDTTFALRDKEEANDYRYFPEPDLAPIEIDEVYIQKIKAQLPTFSFVLQDKYQNELGLSEYDAELICADKSTADYFEKIISINKNYKAIANWINGPLRQWNNDHGISFEQLTITPAQLSDLINLIEEGKVNFSIASSKILPLLAQNSTLTPLGIAQNENLIQVSDSNELDKWVDEVLQSMPDKVKEYQKGKTGLIGMFVGQVKKLSKGKADPKIVTEILQEKLK
ncbi:Asp-tRNA(Asn)/Glu-tRNA(Gln) amidotransferase subunit GatB [Rhizosphaericola mali]|uniref:Aspartyl/glutamyl-tRNA(Asn/Gln) amidotransferase subunit B n=1 Tax=Rhizosphaericola mali TaxID=2545455 RepID=A0A5P2GC02_9BACT|nr:Asp-tRNA(Asn)/Glu-tRNA(Gln) amidotransferase subunit GatB [Rhizosphaericola mali]QES90743.1 Asp-tRNA(Asn)/Glu-tRNA(Gln) amidotransferase subunit GatB [Rhizosphaericola mali]